ncbi:MAG: hypothetical protein ITG00_00275 [Flavobacterium sp.]|nr:hypothetical protein [Flavobacterium sp.]
MRHRISLFTLISFLILACSKDDDPCSDTTLIPKSLESEYGCTDTKYQMEIDLAGDFTIISDQANFNALVTGSCLPEIDFSMYDLVIGKMNFTSGNTSIEYVLETECETRDQNLVVTFYQNMTAHAPNLTYHALIPKLDGGQDLTVEIIVLPSPI